jgi:hypothetical protein
MTRTTVVDNSSLETISLEYFESQMTEISRPGIFGLKIRACSMTCCFEAADVDPVRTRTHSI